MINLTGAEFAEVYLPPAIILDITDFAITEVRFDSSPFVGLLLELQHPELPGSYRQFYRVPDERLCELATALGHYCENTKGPEST